MEIVNFGEWTRSEITKSGKTISWLAGQVGAHPSLIVKWRTRNSIPKTWYYLKVCIILAELQDRPISTLLEEGAMAMGIEFKINNNK
tara:strand:- start:286 stop:546 length:261 start_codon:yes stop_codon:yes gene_type:complete